MALTLNAAVEQLVLCLSKAEADLTALSDRFEAEFRERFPPGSKQTNPLAVLQRLRKLQREVPAVKQECCEILQSKQELLDSAKRSLLRNSAAAAELVARAGLAPEGAPNEGKEGAGAGGIGAGEEEATASLHAAVAEWEASLARLKGSAGQGGADDRLALQQLNRELASDMLSVR